MTIEDTRSDLSRVRSAPWPRALGTAVIAGLMLGAGDLLLQLALPYPLADLANSPAVWAVAAFFFGVWARRHVASAAVGGAVLLVVAVETYYLTAAFVLDNDLAIMWSRVALLWMFFGVVAGVLFAAAGAYSRHGNVWIAALGSAMPAAVLFGEAAVWSVRDYLSPTVVLLTGLGIAALFAAGRDARRAGRALLVAIPLVVLCYFAYGDAGVIASF